LYIPLGGSKCSIWIKIRNTFIIFLVSGFWHGANWTFIIWGFLNALYIMPSILFNTNRNNLEIVAKGRIFPTLKEFFSILFTFSLTVLAWIFFRAESVQQAIQYISTIFSTSFFEMPAFRFRTKASITLVLAAIFIFFEWLGRENDFAIQKMGFNWNRNLRWLFYFALVFSIFYFAGKEQVFIYFNF